MNDQQLAEIQLRLADSLAEYILRDRLDKQGQTLVAHARRVAAKVSHLSHEQRLAALLHDTIEENVTQSSELSATIYSLFGVTVSNLVDTLTRKPDRDYQEYIEIVALYPQARAIKLADLNDNLDPSRGPIEESLRLRYEKAKRLIEEQEERDGKIKAGE